MDREKVIKELEILQDICNAKSNMAIGKGKVAWAGYANTAGDAIVLLKNMNNIRFFIPSDQIIPTDLWLIVGKIKVYYERIYHGFIFTIYESDADKAKGIIDEIVEQIISDHDESQHGVSWRTTSLEEVKSDWDGCHVYEWHYRVRDSY